MPKIAVIGAGAAGCFCAVNIARLIPGAQIDIYEAGKKPLAKVALTGGGRCNLTNTFQGVKNLQEVYPRGANLMKRCLNVFSSRDVREWFRAEGVVTVVEDAGRVFPATQDAMTIVLTLQRCIRENGIRTHLCRRVGNISEFSDCDAVVVTTGGGALSLLEGSGIDIVQPVPSLFSFETDDRALRALSGLSVPDVRLGIPGTGFSSNGDILLTYKGFSGPAALRLSSFAARHLAENSYRCPLMVNWTGLGEQQVRDALLSEADSQGARMVVNSNPFGLPSRLWEHLTVTAGLRSDIRWAEIGRKGINKLTDTLVNYSLQVVGRTAGKDEFVTCGGVSLQEVSSSTLECKKIPGLYFAGEVLDVDALTGGFNLQAAWSTAYVVAKAVALKCQMSLR